MAEKQYFCIISRESIPQRIASQRIQITKPG